MTTGALLWFIIFAIFAALFFGIALVVAFRGSGELYDLLKGMKRRQSNP